MPLTTRDKSYFGDKPLLGHEQLRKSDLIVWIVNKYLRKVLVCKTPGEPSLLFWCLSPGLWGLGVLPCRAHLLCPTCHHKYPLAAHDESRPDTRYHSVSETRPQSSEEPREVYR